MRTRTRRSTGFLVPQCGFSGQLGIIGYEGDDSLTGDSFLFNGSVLSNPLNPATNFFNSTRSTLGSPVSITGIFRRCLASHRAWWESIRCGRCDGAALRGSNVCQLGATSNGDLFFLGGFATGISTLFPVFSDSTKTYANVSRPGKPVIPGDTVKYTLTVLNNGSDTSINTVLRDPLPPELLHVCSGIFGTSRAEPTLERRPMPRVMIKRNMIRTRARLSFAWEPAQNASTGGTVAVGDTTTIEFNAVVSRAIRVGSTTRQHQWSRSTRGGQRRHPLVHG